MRNPTRIIVCALCLTVGLSLTACSPETSVTVIPDPDSEISAEGITPLERGKIRRAVEASAQEAIDAWLSGDRDTVIAHFGPDGRAVLFQRWDEAGEQNQTIERNHEFTGLATSEMNDSGTQALVSYRFTDNSVVRDSTGAIILSRDGAEADMQFTMEPESEGSDTWIVVRMVGTTDSIR